MGITTSLRRIFGILEEPGQRWIIASNRLPFRLNSTTGQFERSSGGLVTAISGIRSETEIIWVGVAPEGLIKGSESLLASSNKLHFHPIFLDTATEDLYYNGMCNNVLWPLLHYEYHFFNYENELWDAYQEINKQFAETIASIARDGDLVWVHDFHLMLVGGLLKSLRPKLKTGFFLHTPFPSSEVFRLLPVRKEILKNLVGFDLIGFHDYSYLRHFTTSVQQILGLQPSLMSIRQSDHIASLGVFPVSIDTPSFQKISATIETESALHDYLSGTNVDFVILGVDRLDYIKGLKLKMQAFRELLFKYPEMLGRVCLLQVAVPSRTEVAGYIEYRREVEQLVGEINGTFGRPNYVPVQYIFSSVEHTELLALYRLADVLLITSRRDGMNLVALEYIASQDETDPGVVVLSEFAGAVSTLSHVMPINPWDASGTAEVIHQALSMSLEERKRRHGSMLRYLANYTATDWAESYFQALERGPVISLGDKEILLSSADQFESFFKKAFAENERLVLFLDYDGTLVSYSADPESLTMEATMRDLIQRLSELSNVKTVIVSGRKQKFLEIEFGDMSFPLAGEHGAEFFTPETKEWSSIVRYNPEGWSWYSLGKQVMEDYTNRVPDSFIEEKRFSLVWHYRRSPEEFGEYQALRLKQDLDQALANLPATVIFGSKAVELRAIEASKGAFVHWYLENHCPSEDLGSTTFVALGDDSTDEDMFREVASKGGYGIKVGPGTTAASHRIAGQSVVVEFLGALVKVGESKIQ